MNASYKSVLGKHKIMHDLGTKSYLTKHYSSTTGGYGKYIEHDIPVNLSSAIASIYQSRTNKFSQTKVHMYKNLDSSTIVTCFNPNWSYKHSIKVILNFLEI